MELDDAYANAPYIPEAADYPPRWQAEADAYRTRLAVSGKARLGLMYGHGTREAMDLFLPDGLVRGLVVFVHGGYWMAFDRSDWSHLAEGARQHGWAVALPSYDLCPRVRIPDITAQMAQAISVAAREIDGPIRLTGHSAGGHLVARMTASGVLPDDVAGRLAHVMPISPVADLRPLLKTSMNQKLGLDDAMAEAESVVLQPAPACPATVWVGADERPAFLDQARWLAEAWGAAHVIDPDRHHFNVIDGLAEADSRMTRALLSL